MRNAGYATTKYEWGKVACRTCGQDAEYSLDVRPWGEGLLYYCLSVKCECLDQFRRVIVRKALYDAVTEMMKDYRE